MLFAATLDEDTRKKMIAEWFKDKDPFLSRTEIILDNTVHMTYDCTGKCDAEKLKMIEKIFDLNCYYEGFKAIVFCWTRNTVDEMYRKITSMGYNCSRYHSNVPDDEKEEQYKKFIKGDTKVLISTDLIVRNINIDNISLVVNYDLPMTKDNTDAWVLSPITYVHRTGRAGRYGRRCLSMTIMEKEKDKENMDKIKEYVNKKFQKVQFREVDLKSLDTCVMEHLKDDHADTEVEKESQEVMIT